MIENNVRPFWVNAPTVSACSVELVVRRGWCPAMQVQCSNVLHGMGCTPSWEEARCPWYHVKDVVILEGTRSSDQRCDSRWFCCTSVHVCGALCVCVFCSRRASPAD